MAGEQWTCWQVHFCDVSFTNTLKLSLHVKIMNLFDWIKQVKITAEAGRLRHKFLLALAELNPWSFC